MWDWAEQERDNDLTKNYPFPVPRIRGLSDEFTVASYHEQESNSLSSSGAADEDTATVQDESITAAPSIHHESDPPNWSVVSQKQIDNERTINHASSDPQLVHKPNNQQRTSFSHNKYNRKYVHTVGVPRAARRVKAHRRSTRRFADVKSLVVEPPDANQDDVCKARFKLQNKIHALEV